MSAARRQPAGWLADILARLPDSGIREAGLLGRTVVGLFGGIGGFELDLEDSGFSTIAFAENDPYACAVLRARFPRVLNLGDLAALKDLSLCIQRPWTATRRRGLPWPQACGSRRG
jgi:C-5 cytosine-specific DNA methylase